MLTYLEDEQSAEISSETLDKASEIIDWYLHQASELFYPGSERYQFEQDVYELFSWLKDKFSQNNGMPILKNEILRRGPNRLRYADILDPLLFQLVSLKRICIFRTTPVAAKYIAMPAPSHPTGWSIPHCFFVNGYCPPLTTHENIRGKYDNSIFEQSRMYYLS